MDNKLSIKIITFLLSIISLLCVGWWLSADPTSHLVPGEPGKDERGKGMVAQEVNIGEHFEYFSDSYTELTESWPRFRGSDFDNISKSEIKLIDDFGQNGPSDRKSVV